MESGMSIMAQVKEKGKANDKGNWYENKSVGNDKQIVPPGIMISCLQEMTNTNIEERIKH